MSIIDVGVWLALLVMVGLYIRTRWQIDQLQQTLENLDTEQDRLLELSVKIIEKSQDVFKRVGKDIDAIEDGLDDVDSRLEEVEVVINQAQRDNAIDAMVYALQGANAQLAQQDGFQAAVARDARWAVPTGPRFIESNALVSKSPYIGAANDAEPWPPVDPGFVEAQGKTGFAVDPNAPVWDSARYQKPFIRYNPTAGDSEDVGG